MEQRHTRRLLLESSVHEEQERIACAHWGEDIGDCWMDVRVTGDVETAVNGPF